MATRDEIPTDLALEIGDDLEPKRFVAVVREFFGLTDELTRTPDQSTLELRVKVREGSNIVALTFSATNDTNVTNAAIHRMFEATNALVEGDLSAPSLTEKAIQHAKKLSDLTKSGPHVTPMRVWLTKRPISFGRDPYC